MTSRRTLEDQSREHLRQLAATVAPVPCLRCGQTPRTMVGDVHLTNTSGANLPIWLTCACGSHHTMHHYGEGTAEDGARVQAEAVISWNHHQGEQARSQN